VLRVIQVEFLSLKESIKTTGIYWHVVINDFKTIKNLSD
jgi:hypothetical protein